MKDDGTKYERRRMIALRICLESAWKVSEPQHA